MAAFAHILELGRISSSRRPEGPRSRRYIVQVVVELARSGGGPKPPARDDLGGGTTSNFCHGRGEVPGGSLGLLNGLTLPLLSPGRPRAMV